MCACMMVYTFYWGMKAENKLSYYGYVEQAHQLLMNFEEPLKDYVHAVQSIKVVLVLFLII